MELYFTITYIIFGLVFYIAAYTIPPKVREILAKENPEYKII